PEGNSICLELQYFLAGPSCAIQQSRREAHQVCVMVTGPQFFGVYRDRIGRWTRTNPLEDRVAHDHRVITDRGVSCRVDQIPNLQRSRLGRIHQECSFTVADAEGLPQLLERHDALNVHPVGKDAFRSQPQKQTERTRRHRRQSLSRPLQDLDVGPTRREHVKANEPNAAWVVKSSEDAADAHLAIYDVNWK